MKRRAWLLFSIVILLFLTGCTTKKPSIQSTKGSEEAVKTLAAGPQEEILLIQVENNGFPQAQGIYDLYDNKLTIVKQYLPVDTSEVPLEEEKKAAFTAAIEKDFEEHFGESSVTMSHDPFKAYETDYTQASFSIKDNQLIIKADGFVKNLTFIDDKQQRLEDENHVEYEIQYE